MCGCGRRRHARGFVGYERVENVDRLEADECPCRLVGRHEARILGASRRNLKRRHRKGRTLPSTRSLPDRLHGHHDDAADRKRPEGEACVPVPSATPLAEANRRPVAMAAEHADLRKATFDVDATIVPGGGREPLFTYRAANGTHPDKKGYQPLNCFLAETGTMLCTEMRDGNVPAREGNARVHPRALARLPDLIEEVMIRSDSAGHSADVIQLCNRPEPRPAASQRFGASRFRRCARRSELRRWRRFRRWTGTLCGPRRMEHRRRRQVGACGSGLGGRGHRGSELLLERSWAQQARGDLPVQRFRRVLPDALGVNDEELPHHPDKPAYAIRVLITNIPAPGEGRAWPGADGGAARAEAAERPSRRRGAGT